MTEELVDVNRLLSGGCDLCGPSGKISYNIVEHDLSLSFNIEEFAKLSTASRIVSIPCPNCDRVGYLRGKRYIVTLKHPGSAFAMRKNLSDFDWSRFPEIFEEKRAYYRERQAKIEVSDNWLLRVHSDIGKLEESGIISSTTLDFFKKLVRESE